MRAYKEDPDRSLSPKDIKEHLISFCQQQIGKPVTLVGASLGGMLAIDFASEYPEVNHLSMPLMWVPCAVSMASHIM